MHPVSNLNAKQKEMYDYVSDHPNAIVTVQAGPGTGKTYTLKTIAHNAKRPSSVIIYKHDLLTKFKYCATRYTLAKLFMLMFNMQYYTYRAFVNQICQCMSTQEFIYCLLAMLNQFHPPPFYGGHVLIDEYTVIPKPLLVVLLIVLKQYGIGTIVSGDCNQLQSIQNSQNNGVSSFEIAELFSAKVFSLEINERCADPKYNTIVKFISKISSSRKMDASGYALVAALFLDSLSASSPYTDIHLAGTHKELTRLIHMYVVNENIPVEFYQVKLSAEELIWKAEETSSDEDDESDGSLMLPNGMLQPSIVSEYLADRQPKKFLPYLPLHVGGLYYVKQHSEAHIGRLMEYDETQETVTMRMNDGVETKLSKSEEHDAIFEAHREYILRRARGKVYNYPIYPVNIMSMHKCQGCTMSAPLDIHLGNTTYQGMYVAISRVTHAKYIRRIVMPDMLSYLLSAIINFPEHVTPRFDGFTEEMLDSRMLNYKLYKIYNPRAFVGPLSEFCNSNDREARVALREQLIQLSKTCSETLIQLPEAPSKQDLLAINCFVAEFEVFMRAALIAEPTDRAVWLHEYMLRSPRYSMLLQNPSCYKNNALKSHCRPDMTYPFTTSTLKHIEDCAVLDTEQFGKESPRGLFPCGEFYYKVALTDFQKQMHDTLKNDPEAVSSEWLRSVLPEVSYESNPETVAPIETEAATEVVTAMVDDRVAKKRKL